LRYECTKFGSPGTIPRGKNFAKEIKNENFGSLGYKTWGAFITQVIKPGDRTMHTNISMNMQP